MLFTLEENVKFATRDSRIVCNLSFNLNYLY